MSLKINECNGAQYMKEHNVYEYLPWYVNGSLGANETVEIKNSLTNNEELMKEYDFLSKLRNHIKGDEFQSPGEIGLQRLRRWGTM